MFIWKRHYVVFCKIFFFCESFSFFQGVIDTALRTANSGYLYRRLDFTASPVVVPWQRKMLPFKNKDIQVLKGPFKNKQTIEGKLLKGWLTDGK